jgi:poly(A) polymerase
MTKSAPLYIRKGWLKDQALQKLLAVLNKTGTTRVAGGAVRNALLGLPVSDVDLATTLPPQEVMAIAEQSGLGVHPTGIEHGTVMLVADGRPFEVTTLRVDVETYGRHARVEFTDDWMADAARRDFTMNALYCDARGKVHDPLDGYPDLKRRLIRFVGKPEARIREDYLRILRFFRFNAQYGRGTPDADGLKHSVRLRKHLSQLSGERIRQELWKLLAAPGAVRMLKVMKDTGVSRVILGQTQDVRNVERMVATDEALALAPDPLLRLELLTGDARAYRDRLKLTKAEMARLKAVRETAAPLPNLRPPERRVVLYQLGRQAYSDSIRLAWARSKASSDDRAWRDLLQFERKTELPRFPVTGSDLKRSGIEAGPQMGAVLKALEDWWIAAGFPEDKEAVLRRLQIMSPLRKTAREDKDEPPAHGGEER